MQVKRKLNKSRPPWNKGKLMGEKSPLTPQEIGAIRRQNSKDFVRIENILDQ